MQLAPGELFWMIVVITNTTSQAQVNGALLTKCHTAKSAHDRSRATAMRPPQVAAMVSSTSGFRCHHQPEDIQHHRGSQSTTASTTVTLIQKSDWGRVGKRIAQQSPQKHCRAHHVIRRLEFTAGRVPFEPANRPTPGQRDLTPTMTVPDTLAIGATPLGEIYIGVADTEMNVPARKPVDEDVTNTFQRVRRLHGKNWTVIRPNGSGQTANSGSPEDGQRDGKDAGRQATRPDCAPVALPRM